MAASDSNALEHVQTLLSVYDCRPLERRRQVKARLIFRFGVDRLKAILGLYDSPQRFARFHASFFHAPPTKRFSSPCGFFAELPPTARPVDLTNRSGRNNP